MMLTSELEPLYLLVGRMVVYLLGLILAIAVAGSILIAYSFKKDTFLFPNFMLFSITLFETVVKALFRFVHLEDSIVDDVGISIKNRVHIKKFASIPYNQRIIFFPQCLRSLDCPSKLGVEGIQCVNCGRCEIGHGKAEAEKIGYRVFVVPGSSFIKRIVRTYNPKAILGVGCMMEIKSGLELCQSIQVIGIGLTLSKSGCISTVLDWDKYYDILNVH